MSIRATISKRVKTSRAKFEVEKFDKSNDFGLWKIKMKALLVQHDLGGALKVKKKLPVDLSQAERKTLMSKALSAIQLSLLNKVLWEDKHRLKDISASLNSKELQKKVMEHCGGNDEGLVARGRSSEKRTCGRSKSRGRKLICWNCNEKGHRKRDYPRRRGKKGELSGNAMVFEESHEGRDILIETRDGNACAKFFTIFGTSEGGNVRMANGDMCDAVGMGEACLGLKKNLISLCTLDKLGYKYGYQGEVIRISNGTLVVVKGLLQKGLSRAYAEDRWKSLGGGGAWVQSSGNLADVEIIQGRSEWRPKSLLWNSLQAGDRQSKQLRSRERCGFAELVVSCDPEVRNTTCRKVDFERCTS
ncbi:hypothetical protein CRG98_010599 [Punica granatum]|uniref:CCHC-type domain-containing protein n=1 Tax=Punica granatum TaxID=22663 RepID=A0A2I0KKJ7_PUNGR|nr:hypothetical protein CRG98_010599 [Punica granatum]